MAVSIFKNNNNYPNVGAEYADIYISARVSAPVVCGNFLEGVKMWNFVRKEVRANVDERLSLEGDSWAALEELGNISQVGIHRDNVRRYSLYRSDCAVYYIRPGVGSIYILSIDQYDCNEYKAAEEIMIGTAPSDALRELIRLSLLE